MSFLILIFKFFELPSEYFKQIATKDINTFINVYRGFEISRKSLYKVISKRRRFYFIWLLNYVGK